MAQARAGPWPTTPTRGRVPSQETCPPDRTVALVPALVAKLADRRPAGTVLAVPISTSPDPSPLGENDEGTLSSGPETGRDAGTSGADGETVSAPPDDHDPTGGRLTGPGP